jgi:hypothetical protein
VLRNLTNFSMDFTYFNKNDFVEFTKPYYDVAVVFWGELLWLHYFFLLFSHAICAESFFNTIILNRSTKISDKGLSALGVRIKELRSLTNLSLNFKYFI